MLGEGLHNPNDRIRQLILEYFYGLHDLKSRGLKTAEIVHNLLYLVETGWTAEDAVSYTIPGKGVTAKTVKYRISDLGVDYFEGPSKFQKMRNIGGIDVSNVSGIVVIGD